MQRGWPATCALGVVFLAALSLVPVHAAGRVSQEQRDLYMQIMQDPENSELNLRYARGAEAEGQPRLALAAYERVLLNDPDNEEAREGYQRVRRLLQPPSTQVRLQVGAGVDTNPRNDQDSSSDEVVILLIGDIRDERPIDTMRWRTSANLSAEYTTGNEDLNYGYLGARTGPLFDVSPGVTVYPSFGGGVASLDERLYFAETFAGLAMEGRFGGVFERVRLGIGYRSYGEDMTADQGFFADLVGQIYFPDAFGLKGVAVLAPWARWSGIDGTVINGLNEEVSPARYVEWGLEAGYYITVIDDVTLGVTVRGRERLFLKTDTGGDKRNDFYVSPGLNVKIAEVLPCACDVILDYRYRWNDSNDDQSDYVGDRFIVSFATRF
ncbi:MAG: hypothetical protein GC199_05560 [Alphaproteobacteria bacterium]|nr:hypothetical protein [Alphaproteobacteria bacterium]